MPTRQQLESALMNADKAGDVEAAKQLANALKSGQYEDSMPQGSAVDALVEPLQAVGGGMFNQAVAGVKGLADLAINQDSGSATNTINQSLQSAPDFSPETQAGKEGLQTLGDLMKKGIDIVNFPISGLAGLADLAATGDINQASQMVGDIQGKGLSQTLGDDTFDATGNPLAATAALMAPDVVATITGTKAAKSAAGAAKEAVGKIPALRRSPKGLIDATTGHPSKEFSRALKAQGATFDNVIDEIPRLADDMPPQKAVNEILRRKIRAGDTDGFLATKKIGQSGKVVDDELGKEAIKQGFRDGDIQMMKVASEGTRRRMKEMVDIRRSIHGNERKAVDTRPTDVIGESFLDRFKHIRYKADLARKELNQVAAVNLPGKQINTDGVVNNFLRQLDNMDVEYDMSSGVPKVSFKGSMIAKDKTSQRVINDVLDLLAEPRHPDALRAHKLKRQLDSLIDYNKKAKDGLTDAGRNIAKSVRKSLNDAIREVDDDYMRVNDELSKSIGAMDDFEKVLGPSIDIWSDGAGKAIGQDLRGLLSNRKSRVKLENAMKGIDETARELGGVFDDDLGDLVVFAKTLDDKFGATARNSFSGEIQSGVKSAFRGKEGLKDALIDKLGEKLEAARNIDDEHAFRSLDEILKSQSR